MVKAEDIKYVKERSYDSILPYLRSKAQKAEKADTVRTPVHKKPVNEAQTPATTLNAYDEARREILEEE